MHTNNEAPFLSSHTTLKTNIREKKFDDIDKIACKIK